MLGRCVLWEVGSETQIVLQMGGCWFDEVRMFAKEARCHVYWERKFLEEICARNNKLA